MDKDAPRHASKEEDDIEEEEEEEESDDTDEDEDDEDDEDDDDEDEDDDDDDDDEEDGDVEYRDESGEGDMLASASSRPPLPVIPTSTAGGAATTTAMGSESGSAKKSHFQLHPVIIAGASSSASSTTSSSTPNGSNGSASANLLASIESLGADQLNHLLIHYCLLPSTSGVTIRLMLGKGASSLFKDHQGRTALHAASYSGNVDAATQLVLASADVNQRDKAWITPLHIASSRGLLPMVQFLIEKEAEINIRDKLYRTPLHYAALNGHMEVAALLLKHDADSHMTDRCYRTPFHLACYSGNANLVFMLISSYDAQISAKDRHGRTGLHWAAYGGCVEIVRLLVQQFLANPNSIDKKGLTPLHAATAAGDITCINLLLSLDASLSAVDKRGRNALHIAARTGHFDTCVVLLNQNFDVDALDADGNSYLHLAAKHGHAECTELFLARNANPNLLNASGFSPLHLASKRGHSEVVGVILENAACNINLKSALGDTAMHFAASNGFINVVELLLARSALANIPGLNDMLPIHLAALKGHEELCRTLMMVTPVKVAVDGDKRSCLHAAAFNGNYRCVELFMRSGLDLSALDALSRSPLHYAALGHHLQALESILTFAETSLPAETLRALVGGKDKDGRTPLHYCAAFDDEEAACVEVLLKHGADGSRPDHHGRTAIHFAALNSNAEVMDAIISSIAEDTSDEEAAEMIALGDNDGIVALHVAAKCGNNETLVTLLEHGTFIDAKDAKGRTPLFLAAFFGQAESADSLLSRSASAEIKCGQFSRTPVHVAALNGHSETLDILLDSVENPDMQDDLGQTPLFLACTNGHADVVSLLVNEKSADCNMSDKHGVTPLMACVLGGHDDLIETLVSSGASLSAGDKSGRTALHFACLESRDSMVKLLIDETINVNAVDASRLTPLHYCCVKGSVACLHQLVDNGALDDGAFANGVSKFSPLHAAIAYGQNETAEALLSRSGALFLNVQDDVGRTPLHYSCLTLNISGAEILVGEYSPVAEEDEAAQNTEQGNPNSCELNTKDVYGMTPLLIATSLYAKQREAILRELRKSLSASGSAGNPTDAMVPASLDGTFTPPTQEELDAEKEDEEEAVVDLIDLLVSKGANVNAVDADGSSSLHFSAILDRAEAAASLLCLGANLHLKNAAGQTPLALARASNSTKCVLLLENFDASAARESIGKKKRRKSSNTDLLKDQRAASEAGSVNPGDMALQSMKETFLKELQHKIEDVVASPTSGHLTASSSTERSEPNHRFLEEDTFEVAVGGDSDGVITATLIETRRTSETVLAGDTVIRAEKTVVREETFAVEPSGTVELVEESSLTEERVSAASVSSTTVSSTSVSQKVSASASSSAMATAAAAAAAAAASTAAGLPSNGAMSYYTKLFIMASIAIVGLTVATLRFRR